MRRKLFIATTAAFNLVTAPLAAETQARPSGSLQGSAALGASVQLAQARTYVDVIGALEANGYSVQQVSTTWLGRVKISARNDVHLREVVVSRSTGEILSDAVVRVFAQADTETDRQAAAGAGAGGAGSAGVDAGADLSVTLEAGDGAASVGVDGAGGSVSVGASGGLSARDDDGDDSDDGGAGASAGISIGIGN